MKNIFFFSLTLLNGACIVAGGDVPAIKQIAKLPKIEVLAPRDSYSIYIERDYVEEDSSYNHRPYSPVSPDSPSSPIKNMAKAPADSYSDYNENDSVHTTALTKNFATQIVTHKIEQKNNPTQQQSAAKKITTLVSSGKPVTAPADSYSGYQNNSLVNIFDDLASALSDSYGAYIPDEQTTAPADSYSGYIEQSVDAI